MEKERAPGTARFGNFINYYTFNPPDRRLNLLPETIFDNIFNGLPTETIHVLDIGCNAGELTKSFYDVLHKSMKSSGKDTKIHILGVDLDKKLIERCKEENEHSSDIAFEEANTMTEEGRRKITEYLNDKKINKFHLITCFSVTLWIHLNHGDEGLKDFVLYLSKICDNLLLEPQPWKCYRNAARRMQKDGCEPFEHYKTIKWRTSVIKDIQDFLTKESDLKLKMKFGITDQWERPICLYSKNEVI